MTFDPLSALWRMMPMTDPVLVSARSRLIAAARRDPAMSPRRPSQSWQRNPGDMGTVSVTSRSACSRCHRPRRRAPWKALSRRSARQKSALVRLLRTASEAVDESSVLVAPAAVPAGCSTVMPMNARAGSPLWPPARTRHPEWMERMGAQSRSLHASAGAEHPDAPRVRTDPWTFDGTQG